MNEATGDSTSSDGIVSDGTIGIVIVDDHPIVREGLRTLLGDEPDLAVLGEAADGESACNLVLEKQPAVVLMDLVLPKLDGIEVTRRLREAGSSSAIVILTSTLGRDMRVQEAIRAGAVGYLLKDVLKADLVQAIRRAAEGRPTLHPEAQAEMVQEAAMPPAAHDGLTPRELEVLRLIANGQSNKRIAAALNLSEGTVKGYVSSVLAKLGVTDRTQAALYAVKHRLVSE